jgi:hypothetical protein
MRTLKLLIGVKSISLRVFKGLIGKVKLVSLPSSLPYRVLV